MNDEKLFFLGVALIAIYVVFSNCLYLVKVVPQLSQQSEFMGPSFLPSKQLEHLRKYAAELEKNGVRSWMAIVAKHFAVISAGLLGVKLILVGLAVAT